LKIPDTPACGEAKVCPTTGTATGACPVTCEMLPTGTLYDPTKGAKPCSGTLKQTSKVKGKVVASFSKAPTVEQATGAMAAALDLDISFLSNVEVNLLRRRLMLDEGRKLNSHEPAEKVQVEINYEVIVPPGKSASDITSKVTQIETGGGSQDAFVNHLSTNAGITVDKDSIKAPQPTVTAVVVTVGNDGKLAEKPVSPSPAPAPAATEESSNTGAIVGGVIGGLVGVALIGGLAYYFLVVKKKSEG